MEQTGLSLCCWTRWALPGLLVPAAIATEGRGRQVMYQADFWIVWHLCLLESPNGFADPKENAICLVTELHSVPALPPSYILQQGFIVPFQSDVLISNSPVLLWLPLLIPFPELLLLPVSPLPLPVGVRHLRGSVSLRSSFTCPPLLSAKREELLWKQSKGKYCHKVAQVLPLPQCSCEPDIKHQSWCAQALGFSGDTKT